METQQACQLSGVATVPVARERMVLPSRITAVLSNALERPRHVGGNRLPLIEDYLSDRDLGHQADVRFRTLPVCVLSPTFLPQYARANWSISAAPHPHLTSFEPQCKYALTWPKIQKGGQQVGVNRDCTSEFITV